MKIQKYDDSLKSVPVIAITKPGEVFQKFECSLSSSGERNITKLLDEVLVSKFLDLVMCLFIRNKNQGP